VANAKASTGLVVIHSQHGLRGGFFFSRVETHKLGLIEVEDRRHLVVVVPGIYDLELRANCTHAFLT
jgi:hypothetical protein